jgi:heme o synthase
MKGVPKPTKETPLGERRVDDETIRGVAPTRTVGETYAPDPVSIMHDLSALFRPRVTAFVILTAWVGYLLAAKQALAVMWSWKLLGVLAGIGLVSSGAAALNQVLEREADARMLRTKDRPLPAKRLRPRTAVIIGVLVSAAGCALLYFAANLLTTLLTLATMVSYVLIYTPLKKLTPWSTFVGAVPGAMPPLLGWTAVANAITWEAGTLFAILFLWQFPHFLSIAWLHREDYERGGIRMLPVLDATGKRTTRQILGYGAALIPVSVMPTLLGFAGFTYLIGAIGLGIAYLAFGVRLSLLRLPPTAANSKKEARELLQASVAYVPLLFGLLLINGLLR